MTAEVPNASRLPMPNLVVIVAVHVALDLALSRYSWFWNQPMLMVALAMPLSQTALLTMWAAVVSNSPVLRFAVPAFGTVSCWYLLSLILPWGQGEEATAAWAIALVVQVATIFVAVGCHRLSRALLLPRKSELGDMRRMQPFTFGLRTVMLWTTVVGLGFGFIQFGRQSWQWTAGVFQWELLGAVPIIGVTNGLVAVLWLWALSTGGLASQTAKIMNVVLIASGLAALQCYATEWITGTLVINLYESLILVAAQSVILWASLVLAKVHVMKAPLGASGLRQ